ncbi:monovalent cation:proton antiporter-2 (CPA2) family protein [Weeksellaceae bacterium KMM 9713]|uniref:Monovalent cation:proton antiporter-2 (CPA2) family protein n=1 Tax=Profundicola chukchiensis TaxID=2961959 RepID=A0A9X4MXQ8_9FLAO|nr:monovalent cation:proton antiporter-2 (CPA2) family protein [Profundicola chukchiensis]MDG4945457.1 monovalent cation:proton antiporter-2 (CPA2) family protein [Profundicola chukchiensis]MDG4950537.1 monovalent cation:proton antiporter-2 (CPA2) family protein [Profundicola chukchiensis]
MDDFLLQAVIYLSAAVLCVPIAKRLGLSSVLGYIIAGMIIGPYILGLIGQKGKDVMHFAEFGVVMMLFLIGLELEPKKFWRLRRFIVGMGLFQVILSSALLFAGMYYVLGWDMNVSIAVSLTLSLSSTAIVLQILGEKNLSNTTAGRSSFAVLLFQDIAVIPILAMIPFLAADDIENTVSQSIISNLAPWLQVLIVIGAIGGIALAGKFVISPALRWVAKARLQELFTASALLLVVGVSYLMQIIGLSPALGAFLSGVVLANSEFRHELEGDIAPFKGLLLGLFFIGVGASVNFPLVLDQPLFILASVASLMLVKFIVLFALGKLYSKSLDQNLIFAFIMCQAGEFGFVILSFASQLNIIPLEISDQMMAVIALSMFLTPFLFLFNDMFLLPQVGTKTANEESAEIPDDIDDNEVIIAGFGHFGSTVSRLLHANNISMTILDHDSERVDILRKMGYKVFYGDATRLELLKAAHASKAKLFIACVDNPEVNLKMAEIVRKNFPNLKIMVRARNRIDAYNFIDIGIDNYYRETLYTAVHLGVDALTSLGMRRYTATRQGYKFIKYDTHTTQKLSKKRHDQKAYFDTLRNEINMQEDILKTDLYVFKSSEKWVDELDE